MSVFLVVGLYATITSIILEIMYNAQPTPFIDEIFHIPQAQKYCSGKFNEVQSQTLNSVKIMLLYCCKTFLSFIWFCELKKSFLTLT